MTDCHTKNNAEKRLSELPPMPSLSLSRRKLRKMNARTQLLLFGIGLLFPSRCHCFLPTSNIPNKLSSPLATSTTSTTAFVTRTRMSMVYNYDLEDPDMMAMFAGGERYENVPLPDSMIETTLFVGNLCEFARDEDLSQKFRSVTNLQSLPACVARRPNSQSLEYGFVAFPTVEEKEAAIIRFHGVEFMGRQIKVEEIVDHPRKGRVNVPEKLVTYVLGIAKKTPRGKNDFSLRKISNPSKKKRQRGLDARDASKKNNNHRHNNNNNTQGRRKGDRKQKRANHKRERRRSRDEDFFF